ncbi:hypothetical protein MKW92_039060, partial [Papaver armeniacum]
HLAGRRRRITDLLVSQDTTEDENMSRLRNSGGELEALKEWEFLDDYDSVEE